MKIISHRANSLRAIEKALKQRVDKIEVDVRVNGKGVPVLCHDKELSSGSLPLKKALKQIADKCPVIVEIKPSEVVEPILEIIKNYKNIEVASFDFQILKKVRALSPRTRLIVLDKWSGVRASRRARTLNTPYIAMNQKWLWSGFILSMSSSGFKLSAYTLNDPVKAHRWARRGLYGVVTDYPERFM